MPTQNQWRFCEKCNSMFYDGYPAKGICRAGGGHHAAGFDFVLPHDEPETPNKQRDWRYCQKCQEMFYDGYQDKGNCPSGGGHSAAGYIFCLPHDMPETPEMQAAWRYCGKCHAMFYDGFPNKGVCINGGHEAAGWNFALPHFAVVERVPTQFERYTQNAWRYCGKCHGMFFDGYDNKGRCAAGGGHEAAGFDFYLTHDVPETEKTQVNWRYCEKCHGMFYDGYPEKGACPAGGGHSASGYNFTLAHDAPGTGDAQTEWRYCGKCHGMFYNGFPEKGTCAAGGHHDASGFVFILPHDINRPLEFNGRIQTGGLAALGGWIKVTIGPNGTARWQGHAHNSGADGYDFAVSAMIRVPSGRNIAFSHSGSVGGTFTAGSRDHDWDETIELPAHISARYAEFSAATFETNLEYDSDMGSVLEAVGGWMLKFGVGSALGPVGALTFIGLEAGSLISTGSLVPGARLASGILWMAGPANSIFAVVAYGIASAGSKERELTQEEYDWANRMVFKGSLPPRETLILTDTIGAESRAFTFPRFDGKTTLNMGPGSFADPRKHNGENGPTYGRTYIHELVHTCQISHSGAQLSLLADALASKVAEAHGDNPYTYGPAGADYTTLNLEQQAQIVSDWFVGNAARRGNTNHSGRPMDEASAYYPYIVNNVRIGRF